MPFRAGSVADHLDTHGWLIGAFADGLHHADGVEVKWGRHPAGEQRAAWNRDPRPTLCVLVAGRFRVDLPNRSLTLAEPGDYALWQGEPHSWQAETDSVCVTVRWVAAP